MTLAPARFKTANDFVYFHLRRWIIEGELKPGERLDQVVLANRLDASRMPVRTALERLAAEGLVVIVPHRGATVAEMSVADMQHLYAVRMRLEPWAVRLAAGRMDAASLAEAESLLRRAEAALEADDWAEYLDSNRQFYGLLWQATDNPVLIQLLGQLAGLASRYRWMYVRSDGKRALRGMQEVLEGLRAGRPEAAADGLMASMVEARDTLEQLIAREYADGAAS